MKAILLFLFLNAVVSVTRAQWVPQATGSSNSLTSIFFTNTNTGFAVGENGTILKTSDGGLTWSQKVSGTSLNLNSVHFPDSITGYVVGDGGSILKSSDGGENWSELYPGLGIKMTSVHFTNPNTGYVAGSSGDSICILKTTDGGSLWNLVYLQISINAFHSLSLNSIHFPSPDIGYAAGYSMSTQSFGSYSPFVLKTTNGGLNWSQSFTGASGQLFSVFFTSADTGFCAGGRMWWANMTLFQKTTNGGLSWTDVQLNNYYAYLKSVYFSSPDTGYAAGLAGSVLKTTNGGNNWSQLVTGITAGLNAVFFPAPDTGFIAGNFGTILATTNGGGFPVGENEGKDIGLKSKVFPNPVHQSTTFSFTLKEPGKVKLEIFDRFGWKVAEPVNEILPKGEHQVRWNIRDLPAGMYFYQMQSGKEVCGGKMVVVR